MRKGRVKPHEVFIAPVKAVQRLCERLGRAARRLRPVELNEAFAAQAAHNIRELDLDPERVNVNGGAIALGHPIGASGARVLTTLLYALRGPRAADRASRRCAWAAAKPSRWQWNWSER